MINRCLITVSSILRQSFSVWCALALGVPFVLIGSHSANADPLDVFQDCDLCPEMIELPMGSFLMGAPPDQGRRNVVIRDDGGFKLATSDHQYQKTDEGPIHRVTVDIQIAMSRTEITHDQWMACVADAGCGGYSVRTEAFNRGPVRGKSFIGGTHPVSYVSFNDAQLYVNWLNEKARLNKYRLPTEAEWEYAARAGTNTRFSQGAELTTDQANFSGRQTEKMLQVERTDLITRPSSVTVHSMDAANTWGLRHMSGNIGELTLSCYSNRYVGWSTTSEWLANSYQKECPKVFKYGNRVKRGGSFGSSMDIARVAWRGISPDDLRISTNGFRIVKELTK